MRSGQPRTAQVKWHRVCRGERARKDTDTWGQRHKHTHRYRHGRAEAAGAERCVCGCVPGETSGSPTCERNAWVSRKMTPTEGARNTTLTAVTWACDNSKSPAQDTQQPRVVEPQRLQQHNPHTEEYAVANMNAGGGGGAEDTEVKGRGNEAVPTKPGHVCTCMGVGKGVEESAGVGVGRHYTHPTAQPPPCIPPI
jgi:hypothetical protein